MTNETYNGWTNYETWRINLECFDGWDIACSFGPKEWDSLMWDILNRVSRQQDNETISDQKRAERFEAEVIDYLAEYLSDRPFSMLQDVECPIVRGWADSFARAANFREIAAHYLRDDYEFQNFRYEITKNGGPF